MGGDQTLDTEPTIDQLFGVAALVCAVPYMDFSIYGPQCPHSSRIGHKLRFPGLRLAPSGEMHRVRPLVRRFGDECW
eukprot:886947-Amphidinium_carterae.1